MEHLNGGGLVANGPASGSGGVLPALILSGNVFCAASNVCAALGPDSSAVNPQVAVPASRPLWVARLCGLQRAGRPIGSTSPSADIWWVRLVSELANDSTLSSASS